MSYSNSHNDNCEIHSVILNMNKNYSNNKGSNFSQIVNKQLALKPNSLVALYTGNLVRKPIVIEADMVLDIELKSFFPTTEQITAALDKSHLNDIFFKTPAAITITMPSGYYSKMSFARTLCDFVNIELSTSFPYIEEQLNITPIASGNEMVLRVPYRCHFEAKDDNIFLGLRYEPHKVLQEDAEYSWRCPIEDLDDNITTSNGITVASDNENLRFESSTKTPANWNYQLTNTPIKPMCYSKLGDEDALPCDIGWASVSYNVDPIVSTTATVEFVMGLSSTYFTSRWADTKFAAGSMSPDTVRLVDVNEKPYVPNVLIGAYLTSTYSANVVNEQTLTLYVNSNMKFINEQTYNSQPTQRTEIVGSNQARSLCTIDMREFTGVSGAARDIFNTLYVEVYAVDKPHYDAVGPNVDNGKLEPSRDYYFRWSIRSPNSNNGELTTLYDSKTDGVYVPPGLVESAYLFQSLQSLDTATKDVSGGLCPMFFFRQSSSDLKVSNPCINSNISYSNLEDLAGAGGTFRYNVGVSGYSFQPTTDEDAFGVPIVGVNTKNVASLENVLGVGKNDTSGNAIYSEDTLFNPNKYPSNKDESGLTKLGTDGLRYNIEVNLPIKAYNTTEETTNDIGQQRTIVYNTNTATEDDPSPTVGLVNKTIEPNNLKYLSLNNPQELKLNTLDIQIRRSKTNELAEEITDASLELLFVSKHN